MARAAGDARFAAALAGALLASLSGPARGGPPIDLENVGSTAPGFTIYGADNNDRAGDSVSLGGDVNGDGIPDLLVGASAAELGAADERTGESYVVFGKADHSSVQLDGVAAGLGGGFAIHGIDVLDRSGLSVSNAGDVNGDGLSDLLIGAYAADANGYDRVGEAYLVFGKSDFAPVGLSDVLAGTGGFAILGDDPLEDAGRSVSGAGDVNGDGREDLIVGVPHARFEFFQAGGEAYVIFGKADGAPVQLSAIAGGSGGYIIRGYPSSGGVGESVAGAGDVNGDGLADLVVAAPNARIGGVHSCGRVYVSFGKTSTSRVEASDLELGMGGYVINGFGEKSYAGRAISGAGDVNGDGLSDVLIGAMGASPGGIEEAGQSYVVFGRAATAPVNLTDVALGVGGFSIDGYEAGALSGAAAAGAGDINGDGLSDLMVGAILAEPGGGPATGAAYLILGKTSGASVALSAIAAGTGGFAMNGIDTFDFAGASLSGGRDVDGEGLPDLVVGAHTADIQSFAATGETYVVFSPEAAAPTGAYLMRARRGDGPAPAIVPRLDFGDAARATVDFSDNDFGSNAAGGASAVRVQIWRSGSLIRGLDPASHVAGVLWRVTTNRLLWESAALEFKLLDSEIAGIPGEESDLAIFQAESPRGRWARLESAVDPVRNRISAVVSSLGYFCVARSDAQINQSAEHWAEYE